MTDSFGPQLEGMDCLGFLPGSACPHYDGEELRRPRYRGSSTTASRPGWAADDGVALHFAGTELAEAVTTGRRRGPTGSSRVRDAARGRGCSEGSRARGEPAREPGCRSRSASARRRSDDRDRERPPERPVAERHRALTLRSRLMPAPPDRASLLDRPDHALRGLLDRELGDVDHRAAEPPVDRLRLSSSS